MKWPWSTPPIPWEIEAEYYEASLLLADARRYLGDRLSWASRDAIEADQILSMARRNVEDRYEGRKRYARLGAEGTK